MPIPAIAWAAIAAAGAETAGAAIQAHQQGKATDAMQAANTDALNFEKQRYANTLGQMSPYYQMGQSALGNLSGAAGNVPYLGYSRSLSGLNQFANGQPPVMNRPTMPMTMQPPTSTVPSVMMRAPNGQQKAVPLTDVAHYQQMGAVVVG